MDITKPQLVKVGAFDYFFSGRFCNTPHGQATCKNKSQPSYFGKAVYTLFPGRVKIITRPGKNYFSAVLQLQPGREKACYPDKISPDTVRKYQFVFIHLMKQASLPLFTDPVSILLKSNVK